MIISLLHAAGVCVKSPTQNCYVLKLQEHSVLEVPVPGSARVDVVRGAHDALHPATATGLISVTVGIDGRGATFLRIKTSSNVGFVVVYEGEEQLLICVDPKIPQVRFLELAQLAGMLPTWRSGAASLAPTNSSEITAWVLAAFADALGVLFGSAGLRATHEHVRRTLAGRIRGRVDTQKFIRQISRARFLDVPCVFPLHDYDNQWNRLLKYAIKVARTFAKAHATDNSLWQRFLIYESRLHNVTLDVGSAGRARKRGRLPATLRHYTDALVLAEWVIDHCSLQSGSGAIRSASMVLDMDKVFERAFLHGVQRIRGHARGQREWAIRLRSIEGGTERDRLVTIRPDVSIVPANECQATLIDTKWKDVTSRLSSAFGDPSSGFGIAGMINADLYQVIAYASMLASQTGTLPRGTDPTTCKAVLVFPCVGGNDTWVCRLESGLHTVAVIVSGWDLSKPTNEGLHDVIAAIEAH